MVWLVSGKWRDHGAARVARSQGRSRSSSIECGPIQLILSDHPRYKGSRRSPNSIDLEEKLLAAVSGEYNTLPWGRGGEKGVTLVIGDMPVKSRGAGSLIAGRGRRSGGNGPAESRRQGQTVNWDDIIIDAAASDTGMRRSNNQDCHAAIRAPNKEVWHSRGHVFMVADGMGAHAVGELASKMACDLIPHNYMKAKVGTP